MTTQPAQHNDCPQVLREAMSRLGVDVDVATVRPRPVTPHTAQSYDCPHGQTYWITPTAAQVLRWRRDGVA